MVARLGFSLLSVQGGMIGGLASFVRHVARHIELREPGETFFFVASDTHEEWRRFLPPTARLIPCELNAAGRVRRVSYESIVLPVVARKLGCRRLYFSNTAAPIIQDPLPIVTVFDVMYLSQENDLSWPRRMYYNSAYSLLRTSVAEVVTISEFSKSDIAARAGIPAARITSVGCGVENEFFDATPSLPSGVEALLPGGPYLLSVAATYRHKRLATLVRAFELIAHAHPDVSLVMVGTAHGPDDHRRDLAEVIARSAFRERIVRMPRLAWGDLPALYKRSAGLVHASAFEGFGIPIAEAMAAGVPVAASPAPAVTEVLGGHGHVAYGWTAEDLAQAIDSLLNEDSVLREDRVQEGKARANTNFRWASVAERLVKVIG